MSKELLPQLDFFDNLDLEDIKVTVPHSHLSRWLPEDSVFAEAVKRLPVARLSGIKQLSFLSYYGPAPESTYFMQYSHTRFEHSLDTGLISGEIGLRNGLDLPTITKLQIAGLCHDLGTPAYGDAIKLLDKANLDEEGHWQELLDKQGIEFLEKLGLTPEELSVLIKNGGLLGRVLDIADRISYVARDVYGILGRHHFRININSYLLQLQNIISRYPHIGDIYQDICLDPKTEDIVFTDVERLAAFLWLRAHLHQKMYQHPTNMGRDLFVATIIKPFYSVTDASKLTPKKLRTMTDEDLMRFVINQYKPKNISSSQIASLLANWYPMYKAFDDEERAHEEVDKLSRGGATVLGVRECKGFDPGTNYKVIQGRKIVPFGEADPATNNELERIVESNKGFFVFYAKTKGNDVVNQLIKAAQEFESGSDQSLRQE